MQTKAMTRVHSWISLTAVLKDHFSKDFVTDLLFACFTIKHLLASCIVHRVCGNLGTAVQENIYSKPNAQHKMKQSYYHGQQFLKISKKGASITSIWKNVHIFFPLTNSLNS